MWINFDWTVKCLYQIWDSFRWVYTFYRINFVKYIKLFKIKGTGYYDINVTVISSQKIVYLPNSNSNTFPVVPAFEKEIVRFSANISWRLDIILVIWSICLSLITYDNYVEQIIQKNSKFCTRKRKRQHCVYCDYNDITMIYITWNMVLLRVRSH